MMRHSLALASVITEKYCEVPAGSEVLTGFLYVIAVSSGGGGQYSSQTIEDKQYSEASICAKSDSCGLVFQALPYVCLLIAMLFFIYAIIGMQVSQNIWMYLTYWDASLWS